MINHLHECEDPNSEGYTDDNSYSCATDTPSVALELLASSTKLFSWFKNNQSDYLIQENPI